MIRKIGALGISLLCLGAIISCEKDFNDIGTNVVSNTKFETGEILLDVEITPIDLESVRADNIDLNKYQGLSGALGEYWLGIYKSLYGKKINASIISQLGYLSDLRNSPVSGIDTVYHIDKIILKLPYPATIVESSGGKTSFKLDSILGDIKKETSILVKRNLTYLNTLDPNNPAKLNNFQSNFNYVANEILNEDLNFSFTPKPSDTTYIYSKINRMKPSETFQEVVKMHTSKGQIIPFLAVPLNLNKMKTLFWDKFESMEFSSKEEFNLHFRGIVIEAIGEEGSLIPFNLNSSPPPSIDFIYTKSVMEGTTIKDTINSKYSFPLSGIRNSKYMMQDNNSTPSNSFVIQGTAGAMAEIKFLDDSKLKKLRTNNWLINDANLTFYINNETNLVENSLPQKLFVYKKENNGSSTQLTDSYKEFLYFGGELQTLEGIPNKYTFKITDYFSNLLENSSNDISPLILKVFNNPTDEPVSNNILDTKIKTYNWNPRNVVLLNGDETANGAKRAVLKISYSKEK